MASAKLLLDKRFGSLSSTSTEMGLDNNLVLTPLFDTENVKIKKEYNNKLESMLKGF